MARPLEEGLKYFPFDTGFFSDKKIKRLKSRYGTKGICVYIYILCSAYGDKGYYLDYDDDLIFDIADELNIEEEVTRQIVGYLLSRSLLDETLAKSVDVLTAKSIQKRFQEAKKGLKRDVFVKAGIWLLEKADTLSLIKVRPDENKSGKNCNKSRINSNKSEKNPLKERKGKEKKIKESKGEYTDGKPSSDARPRFTPPTLEEVENYCNERNSSIDPQRFFNYYTSNGWKVGKNGMKDWKASVRAWERKDLYEDPKGKDHNNDCKRSGKNEGIGDDDGSFDWSGCDLSKEVWEKL